MWLQANLHFFDSNLRKYPRCVSNIEFHVHVFFICLSLLYRNIKQEVSVLRKLRGTLNVVHLEDVFEDNTHVHIVMELCRGGELLSKISTRHYSERTVGGDICEPIRKQHACIHYEHNLGT